ncbi:hypothetical protein R3P38DRAFT_2518817, partial [Favolaschia claudopus]
LTHVSFSRCFNCHTTEPPSWRRSTLNPGKIVCNKCGLYERTHLRARWVSSLSRNIIIIDNDMTRALQTPPLRRTPRREQSAQRQERLRRLCIPRGSPATTTTIRSWAAAPPAACR